MNIFKNSRAKEPDETVNPLTEVEQLKQQLATANEMNKTLQTSLAETEKALLLSQEDVEKAQKVLTLSKYASFFKEETVVESFKNGKVEYEGALLQLLDSAQEYTNNVQESFKNSAPQQHGSFDQKQPDTDKPKSLKEAMDHVKKEYNLKGEAALDKCRELYPEFYERGV